MTNQDTFPSQADSNHADSHCQPILFRHLGIPVWLITLIVVLLVGVFAGITGTGKALSAGVQTATTNSLHTWWHSPAYRSENGVAPDDAVRESPFYETEVSTAADSTNEPSGQRYRSFTYLSVPRNGMDKQGYSDEDGAEFAHSAQLTMSWSTFEYSKDVWVWVHLSDGERALSSANQVSIRPRHDHFEEKLVDSRTIAIRVPYSTHGQRFSVEFAPEQMTSYNDMSGESGTLTTKQTGSTRKIGTEPRNAMLVFAEPMFTDNEKPRYVPTSASGKILYPNTGKIDTSSLYHANADILFFRPGVYWMTGHHHSLLPASVKWIYLAPGAYVKGAFQFPFDSQRDYKVTGYGVLSGEQYVYEPDTLNGYRHRAATSSDCHGSCVKMLRFQSSDQQQHLDLQGITVANPPYHSFVVYGNEDTFSMTVRDYQQVGAWYWQTDGIELYKGSTMDDTFFHSNDDVLKLYHSNTRVNNTIVWKNENGPVIQWGWSPRSISHVRVTGTDVIHNRMYWKDEKFNTCVINSSSSWQDMGAKNTADPSMSVEDIRLTDTTVEGPVNCALRIYSLQNLRNVTIDGLHVDSWNGLGIPSQYSRFEAFTDASGKSVTIGNQMRDHEGLLLRDYTVGGTPILKSGNNWNSTALGRLNFDGSLWDSWDAVAR